MEYFDRGYIARLRKMVGMSRQFLSSFLAVVCTLVLILVCALLVVLYQSGGSEETAINSTTQNAQANLRSHVESTNNSELIGANETATKDKTENTTEATYTLPTENTDQSGGSEETAITSTTQYELTNLRSHKDKTENTTEATYTVPTENTVKKCQPGSECLSLLSCPEMLALSRSRQVADRRVLRIARCGFQKHNNIRLVCCESHESLPSTTASSVGPGQRKSLLPSLCGRPVTEDKIIGGTKTPIGAYPWIAAFGYTAPGRREPVFECSGSIINSKYVLTAAHCVDPVELGIKRLSVIRLGDWNLKTDPDCRRSRAGTKCYGRHISAGYEEVRRHPRYNTRGKSSDDIALVRLNVTLDFEEDAALVEPICLPAETQVATSLPRNRKLIAVGWGMTENGSESDVLLSVRVPIVDDQQCKELFTNFASNQLCVGGEGRQDTCNGDSGGPLVLPTVHGPPFTQFGIVSYGAFPCGMKSFPGVYTSVAEYVPWIVDNLKP